MSFHGEYKVPSGKLVVVDFEVKDGVISEFSLSGDFFIEPDSALATINAALIGMPEDTTITGYSKKITEALDKDAKLLGFTPASVGTAIRRALTGAAQWRDFEWEVVHEAPIDPYLNAALDEVLTNRVATGQRKPTMRIWEGTEPAIYIGSFQSVRNEVDEEETKKRGISIVRRTSGGGAMYMRPEHTITYALYVPDTLVRGMSFEDSYAFLDEWVLEALQSLGIDAHYKPLNDITSPSGKIGGAAQKRLSGGAVLHHVTMAYDMDPDVMVRVLRIGREKLSDKGTKSAEKRVDPLRSQTGLPREEIIERMEDVFTRRHGAVPGKVTEDEWAEARELVENKYATAAWLRRIP